ncbi:hypothetical protein [Tepidibacter formicigenes]|jgi:hypothetical protein|uniref:Lipoprotein n=1 Tax=Tepidibacter formicigenes DSM 15518 TaxID=1123349 RepID=A0A1M6JME9_9FIRM|nr:hypothetical protein [Tepidibacter formicigenes]SHJ47877.1 hypothetical protein SAMN02744037_00139 [Tepidibacter formicigenes DSM 15518]
MIRKKNIIVSFLLAMVAFILVGCKTSIPSVQETKQDMVGKSYYNKYGEYKISSIKEIQTFNITEKEVNKQERSYIILGDIVLNKEFINIKDKIRISYKYIPEQGWKIQNIQSVDDNLIKLKLEKLLQEKDIKKLLEGSYLEYNNADRYITWGIKKEDEIKKLIIKDRKTNKEEMKDDISIELISKNDTEELNADINLKCSFNVYENKWNIDSIKMTKAEKKLLSGVGNNTIKNMLVYKSIPNYIQNIEYGDSWDYYWDIDNEKEIKKINIIEQNTDLNGYTDNVKAEIELEKENIRVKGIINLAFKYDESHGWKLEKIDTPKPFSFTLLKDMTNDIDTIKKDVVGNKFMYQGGFWGNYWIIEEGEIQNIQINKKTPFYYGNTIVLLTHLELKGSSETILGDVYIEYSLNSKTNTWELKGITKVNNFEKK